MNASSEQLVIVALAGLLVGSFLDRCVRRLSLGKSVLWPIQCLCDHCYQGLPLRYSVPLLGYILCRGRCRCCGRALALRRPIIELVTSALLTLLFLWHVGWQGAWLPPRSMTMWNFSDKHYFALFVYHGVLVCFLIIATFIDLELMIIPDSVTIPGMLAGVVLGAFWFVELHPVMLWVPPPFPVDLFSESVWKRWFGGEVPLLIEYCRQIVDSHHWHMNWNRYVGLASGLAGLLAGGGIVWIVRLVCSWAFKREAMGLGDVTLMAMVGAFLGWQTVILAFFLAPLSAVVVGMLGWLLAGHREIPYGPHLSIATVLCIFFWNPLWFVAGPFFYDFSFFLAGSAVMLALLTLVAWALQWIKTLWARMRSPVRTA